MKCEQGDIAKIIVALNAKNIGKTVLVAEYIGYFEEFEEFEYRGIKCSSLIEDHYWWIEAEYGLENFSGVSTPKAYIPDTWLEPIRPTTVEETTEEDVELEA